MPDALSPIASFENGNIANLTNDSYNNSLLSVDEGSDSCCTNTSAPSALRKSKYSSYPYSVNETDGKKVKFATKSRNGRSRRKYPKSSLSSPVENCERSGETDSSNSSFSCENGGNLSPKSVILPPHRGNENIEVFMPIPTRKALRRKVSNSRPSNAWNDGRILMQSSRRSMLFKTWKEYCWVLQKPASLFFFRSTDDYIRFKKISGMNKNLQKQLVKLSIDFDSHEKLKDNIDKNPKSAKSIDEYIESSPCPQASCNVVLKYNVTHIKPKRDKRSGSPLYAFKIERWTDYGVAILAKFASIDFRRIKEFRKVLKKLIKKGSKSSHSKKKLSNDSDAESCMSGMSQSVSSVYSNKTFAGDIVVGRNTRIKKRRKKRR